jgi:hypothetical protein
LAQLARHHCDIGERFGDRVEFYFSRNIIEIIELNDINTYNLLEPCFEEFPELNQYKKK